MIIWRILDSNQLMPIKGSPETGFIMFERANLLNPNTKRKTIKIRKQNYIKNQAEPLDRPSHDTLNKDEHVLVENSSVRRQRFRLIAQRIRIINIHGINKKFRN